MIFVTVGSQEPFDRLVRAVDEWAAERGRRDVFAQIAASAYRPGHIEFTRFLEPEEFARRMQAAKVIVAHAGMGSIISALELGKPIVVMPRRASLRETRNDHQVATAQRFGAQGGILVAGDEGELGAKLDEAVTLQEGKGIARQASPRLLRTLRAFLEGQPLPLHASLGDTEGEGNWGAEGAAEPVQPVSATAPGAGSSPDRAERPRRPRAMASAE